MGELSDAVITAPTNDRSRRSRSIGWGGVRDLLYLFLALGVTVPALVSAWGAAAAGALPTTSFFSRSDDAFYYFTIASRWAAGQGSTFDGLHATNGYQPLWGWMSFGLFAVIRDPAMAAAAVVIVSAVLWTVAVVLVRAIATLLGAPGAGAVAAALTAVVVVRTWFDGMEFPLVAVMGLATVWVALRSGSLSGKAPDRPSVLLLGGLGALSVLTRLDMLAFVALTAVAIVITSRSSGRDRAVLGFLALGPALLTLVVYAAVNAAVFGSPVPESGLVKQLGTAGKPHWATVGDFLTLGFGDRIHDDGALLLVLTGLAAILLLAPSPSRVRWRVVDHRIPVAWLLAVVVAAQLVQVAYYTVSSSWGGELWYYGLVPVGLVLTLTVVLAALPAAAPRAGWVLRAAAVVVVVAVAGRLGVELVGAGAPLAPEDSPMAATAAAGGWADHTLPADARLAMGDWAGGFTWAAHRPVLQTEGLVTGAGYREALSNGDGARYVADQGVDYYVKIGDRTGISEGPGCERFTEPVYGNGPTLFVHVCDSQLVHVTPGPEVEGDVRIWRLGSASLR